MLSIMAALFVKGANDYAEETLSQSHGTLQRSPTLNEMGLRNYYKDEFTETMNLRQRRTKKRAHRKPLDPADILKVEKCVSWQTWILYVLGEISINLIFDKSTIDLC